MLELLVRSQPACYISVDKGKKDVGRVCVRVCACVRVCQRVVIFTSAERIKYTWA
jgi:hypothetical protein